MKGFTKSKSRALLALSVFLEAASAGGLISGVYFGFRARREYLDAEDYRAQAIYAHRQEALKSIVGQFLAGNIDQEQYNSAIERLYSMPKEEALQAIEGDPAFKENLDAAARHDRLVNVDITLCASLECVCGLSAIGCWAAREGIKASKAGCQEDELGQGQ